MSIPIFNVNEMLKYDLDSDEYKKYLEYLNIFNKQEDGKTDQYKKEITEDSYILIDKKDPNKKIIIPPKYPRSNYSKISNIILLNRLSINCVSYPAKTFKVELNIVVDIITKKI
jgi:hypothetical protein